MNGRLKNWLEGDAVYFLLELALVAALAVMLAHWTWTFAAPASLAAPSRAVLAADAKTDVPRGLFGGAGETARAEAVAADLRLVGVIAGPGGRAMFKSQGGAPRIAGAGEAVAPGIVLKEVHADHVVLEKGGALERLKLDRRAAPALERSVAR